jgi:hypothetical protein
VTGVELVASSLGEEGVGEGGTDAELSIHTCVKHMTNYIFNYM